jgi:hypothetical protein
MRDYENIYIFEKGENPHQMRDVTFKVGLFKWRTLVEIHPDLHHLYHRKGAGLIKKTFFEKGGYQDNMTMFVRIKDDNNKHQIGHVFTKFGNGRIESQY